VNTVPPSQPYLDPAWWDNAELRPQLARQDVQALYRWLQRHGWSQAQIAAAAGQTQPEVSAIVNGRTVLAYSVLLRVADGFGIPRGYLGLSSCIRCPDAVGAGSRRGEVKEDDPMFRRQFLAAVAAVAAGGTADGLHQLLPAAGRPSAAAPQRIGASDVAALRQTTAQFRSLAYRFGWGAAMDPAVGFAGWTHGMLNAEQSTATARELRIALVQLHLLIGWAHFDDGQPADARRQQVQALALAQEAEQQALVGHVLSEMAEVSTDHGDPRDGLRLAGYGLLACDPTPAHAAVRGSLHLAEAWAHAHVADARGAEEALSRAADELSRLDMSPGPDWSWATAHLYTPGWLDSFSGRVHTELARTPMLRSHAETAVGSAETALARYDGTACLSAVVMNQISLATSQLLDGDRDEGLQTGHHAVEQAATLHSARTFTMLTRLADVAHRYLRNDPDAVDLRRRIATLIPPNPPARGSQPATDQPNGKPPARQPKATGWARASRPEPGETGAM
jgi:transcriptional regulator with XRE-family HTH domain